MPRTRSAEPSTKSVGRAEVAPVVGADVAVHRGAGGEQAGNVSRSTDTGRPVGMVSTTARSKTYKPALIWSVTGFGVFSRKAVTRPSGSVGTQPNALGSATLVRVSVTSAPVRVMRGEQVRAGRRRDRMSPLKISAVSPRSAGGDVADPAAGAERLGLDDVVEFDAEPRAVAEVRPRTPRRGRTCRARRG